MSRQIREMFESIAPRYDRANDVLSFGIHRLWRRKLLSLLEEVEGKQVVDICAGTGDLTLGLLSRVGDRGTVFGVDFAEEMLREARRKSRYEGRPIAFVRGDALALPLPDDSCAAATVAFGIRNVDNPVQCLREMRRVLARGGKAIVLEFGQPSLPLFRSLYRWYSSWLLPVIGGLITGNREAYSYLDRSARLFPAGSRFLELMREAGFDKVSAQPLIGGVAYIYSGSHGD